MKFNYKFWESGLDFIRSPRQKLVLIKVYVVYALILGVMYAGDVMLDAHRNKSTAYSVAQNFVAQRLVAPASAEFPPQSDNAVVVEYLGKNRYSISGYLYSRNTFGNERRSDYKCVVRNTGSGEWTSESIEFE